MPENGAKTVIADYVRASLADWKPPHGGCERVSQTITAVGPSTADVQIVVCWKKPAARGLKRIEHFVIRQRYQSGPGAIFALRDALDHQVEQHIARIVDEDSIRLLKRGNPRNQRADTDRFEAEQKLKGELCPV